MNPDPSNLTLLLLTIALIIVLNAIVVLSNSSMKAVSRSKVRHMLEDKSEPRAVRLEKLLEKPYKYKYTNRTMNYVLAAMGLLLVLYLPYNKIASVAIYLALLISLSEILPRKLARQHSDTLSLKFAGIQTFMCIILTPVTGLLLVFANLFLKLFRQKTDVDDKDFSEDEVMSMLEVGQESGVIKEEGKKMIGSIFQFDDELAYEIMTPRTDVFLIDINDPPEEYLDELMQLRYSRIPVCENEPDNIIGILHIKDYLIKAREEGFDKVDIKSILRRPYFVPETKNIDALFFELQKEKQHIAILIDEYGGFSGIATMEDIIEEIVGDIDDEYDEEDEIIEKLDESNYLVDGNVDLDDINEELGTHLESENSETIGGFLIDIIGEIPQDGYVNRAIKYENYVFTILSVKERRIEKVRLHIDEPDKEESSDKISDKDEQ
ncbi:hemolysin family protein [Aminicella lysinilytica]|uniref:Putative hemolysin n=1 Tax=Aminicella lysinilytica TaxID=433323 RepID=A0A4V3CRY7_9FIRM|nr:hemolysin family protein [Aminicella lysinilytica]NLD11739.1 HlyC/CorC family transporter [Clostridiales bacterium]TDP58532.1 putative hemolysin [Aminicella lysinilytica]